MIKQLARLGAGHAWGRPLRTYSKVLADFRERNCLPARQHCWSDDISRAMRLPENKYARLLGILREVGLGRSVQVKVHLPLTALQTLPFEDVPGLEFRTYVRVHQLDLRRTEQIIARYRERRRVQGILPPVAVTSLPAAEPVRLEPADRELKLRFQELVVKLRQVEAEQRTRGLSLLPEETALAERRQLLASQGFNLYDFLARQFVMKRSGRFELAGMPNPAKLDDVTQLGIIDGLNWMRIDVRDLRDHVVRVDETMIAFTGKRPVAFASADELSYTFLDRSGRKREGKLVPMVGGWVREEYRRQKLQLRLNYQLLVRRWWRHKFSGGLFRPLRLATRTRNPAVVAGLLKYFSGVKHEKLDLDERAVRQRFADYLKCRVAEDGLVRNAYEQPLFGNGIKLKAGPRARRRVEQALRGVGPLDGRIFVFKLTAWGLVRALFNSWRSRFFRS